VINIILIGGGGHCRACIDVIETEGRFKIYGIIDPNIPVGSSVLGYPIIGSDKDLPYILSDIPCVFITIGQIKNSKPRFNMFEYISNLNASIPIIRSPMAYVSQYATIDNGSIIMHGSQVGSNARIGANCIINSQSLIEHDAVISDHCHIATGAKVNGSVRIGPRCFIGSGAILREGITIGRDSIVGAGLYVPNNIPDGSVYVG